MNTHPIFGNMITGMMEAQRLAAIPSPGLTPPQPMGCPNCEAAERQCDRLAQRINELERESADIAMIAHMQGAERAKDDLLQLQAKLAFRDADITALNLEIKRLTDLAHEAKLAQGQAEDDRNAMLFLLTEIREACGDNGRRMQGELVDYLRILWEEADPDRVSKREAEVRAQDYTPAADPMDAGAWGEDKADAA